MKIPIKRYVPDPQAIANINTVMEAGYDERDPIFIIVAEYNRLLAHHEEETKWMYAKLKEYEEQTIDLFPDRDKWEIGGES